MSARARRAMLLALVWVAQVAAAQPSLPAAPTRWVTDEVGVLSPEVERRLDERLQAYEQATGRQVVVWIGQSTGGVPLEEWAARTFAAWGVGRRGQDDGVAVFLLMEDRRLRVEVGYGLEPVLTDAQASRLVREEALPALRAGNAERAVERLVDRLLGVLGGETGAQAARPSAPVLPRIPGWVVWAVALGVLAVVLGGGLVLLTHPALATGLLVSWRAGQARRRRQREREQQRERERRRRGGGGPWWGGGLPGAGSGGFHWGGGGFPGGGGFSGGGGRSGGGGASGSW